MLSALSLIVMVTVAVATVTVTITRSTLFAPFREWAARQGRLPGKLVGCPYCMSHWVSAVFVLGAHLVLEIPLLWLPLTVFSIIGLAAFVTRGLVWATTLPPIARDNTERLQSALLQAQQTILDQQRELEALRSEQGSVSFTVES